MDFMVHAASSRQIHLKNIVPPTFVIVKIGFQEQNRTGCAVFYSQLYKWTPVLGCVDKTSTLHKLLPRSLWTNIEVYGSI